MITSEGRGMHADSKAISKTMPGSPIIEITKMTNEASASRPRLTPARVPPYPPVIYGGPKRSVGWASPTGTPCPSFPQVPRPNPRSDPTMSIIDSASGPFPVMVAPRTRPPHRPPAFLYPVPLGHLKHEVSGHGVYLPAAHLPHEEPAVHRTFDLPGRRRSRQDDRVRHPWHRLLPVGVPPSPSGPPAP